MNPLLVPEKPAKIELEDPGTPYTPPPIQGRTRFASHDMPCKTLGDLPLFSHRPTQEEVVWKHLKTYKTITMGEAKDKYNIHRLSERIRRIRTKYNVEIVNIQRRLKVNWAVYELMMVSGSMEETLAHEM